MRYTVTVSGKAAEYLDELVTMFEKGGKKITRDNLVARLIISAVDGNFIEMKI